MKEDLLEMWWVHEEINMFLLEKMPDAGFQAVTLLKNGQPATGRRVRRVFAHMHEVRAAHLSREFLNGVPRFKSGAEPDRGELLKAFRAASRAMEGKLAQIIEQRPRFKDRAGIVLLGYLMTHDAHHRGQILLALKQSGVRMPEAARFGIWEHWGRPKLV